MAGGEGSYKSFRVDRYGDFLGDSGLGFRVWFFFLEVRDSGFAAFLFGCRAPGLGFWGFWGPGVVVWGLGPFLQRAA